MLPANVASIKWYLLFLFLPILTMIIAFTTTISHSLHSSLKIHIIFIFHFQHSFMSLPMIPKALTKLSDFRVIMPLCSVSPLQDLKFFIQVLAFHSRGLQ
jgi:hypothetical protein